MTNLTPLKRFIEHPSNDLGDNAWKLLDLVKTMRNKRFMDLGVRNGASSAIMSVEADERKNQACGCDFMFEGFFRDSRKFVSENYLCYQADSVTLGKNWDEDPFDIIFIDTIHTREQVLAELYFWSNHLNENGYFVFHDSHWEKEGGDVIAGKEWKRVDVAITDFFNLPKNVMELTEYENDDILLNHFPGSYGMTFVKVKTLDAIDRFKEGVDWKEVFDIRNQLSDFHLNKQRPDCIGHEWKLDFDNIDNELVINP